MPTATIFFLRIPPMYSIRYLFVLLNILLVQISFTQVNTNIKSADKYRAIHWTIDNGLSESDNYSILKDIKGFLWISSDNGLNRFDGNTFKYYFSDKNNKNSIADNSINALAEDSLHNIWIGTGNGLSRYDIRADTFSSFLSFGGPNALDHASIPFWATKNELFCMDYNLYGIVSYNIHSLAKKEVFRFSLSDSLGLRGTKFFYSVVDEAANCVWMLQETRGELLKISLADQKREHYPWPVYKKNRTGNYYTSAEAMRYDRKRNCIWINSPEGLINFTLKDKQFHHIDALNHYTNAKDYDRWVGIDLDTKGKVWFATQTQGIIIYDPDDQSVEIPFPNDSAVQVDACKYNACLYCDRDGITWTGSWLKTGIYQLVPFSKTVSHYMTRPNIAHSLSDNSVVSFLEGENGKIWIGTFQGLEMNIFDPRSDKFDVIHTKDLIGIKVKPGNAHVFPILVDTSFNRVWIEHNDLYVMDLKTKKCLPVIFKDSTGKVINRTGKEEDIFSIKFNNGCITRAAYGDRQGIFISHKDSAIARELLSFPAENIATPFIQVLDDRLILIPLMPPDSGHQTYTYAYNKLIRTPIPLDSIPWTEVVYNKADESYWVLAERQLFHYDKDFRIIQQFSSKEGLPRIDISSLTLDDKSNLWFHTDRSINQLNTKTGLFSELSEKDGFERMYFINYPGGMKANEGDIYFPTGYIAQGFVRVSPDKFRSPPASIYIENIEVNQKKVSHFRDVNNIINLSLRYFENKITIETGIIDYYSKGSSHIRYKLTGKNLNEDWQIAPYYFTIRYEGLPPGKYSLIIQASNAANEFNGPEKTLNITIDPPFWSTWWFRILATILGLSSVLGFVKYRARNLEERNIMLENKIAERTNELNNSLVELKTTQDQLIQSEKMASLGELTSGIAHEIKNPLNFINNFSEINLELLTEIEEEQSRSLDIASPTSLEVDIETINNLRKNSEKINHHGKRVDDIVKGMLQHSRLGNITKETININVLCEESMKLAYHGYRSKERTFNAMYETRLAPDLPKVKCVPQDLGRVILNIINNAFYAVHDKQKLLQTESIADKLEIDSIYKPSLILTTRKIDYKAPGSGVSITISDNGMGISPNIISKIFQPFFTTKPTGEGTGLGLSMAYDIITKGHGGELKVKSKEGLGTDFEIILPITELQPEILPAGRQA
jgi:signal transduction histidine kinase/ligand-binding sensor domain-containing protein